MPNDIEIQVRKLLLSSDYGTLSTHSVDCPGYPFASIVPVGFDEFNRPIILISRLAQHTHNIIDNDKVSLFFSDVDQQGYEDVQQCARITLLAQAQRLDMKVDANIVRRYGRFYPQAQNFYKKLDFNFYRLLPEKVRFIGGVGKIHWIKPEQLFTENPLGFEVEADIIAHMNSDHRDALLNYCQAAGFVLPEGIAPEMVGVDDFGFFQRIGERVRRFNFPEPVEAADDVRKALITMLSR